MDKNGKEFTKAEDAYSRVVARVMSQAIKEANTDPDHFNLTRKLNTRKHYTAIRKGLTDVWKLALSHAYQELKAATGEGLLLTSAAKVTGQYIFDFSLSPADDYLLGAITEHNIRHLQFISEEMKPQIIQQLREGRSNMESHELLAKRVQTVWGTNKHRAVNFARTEANEVYNQTHLFRYRESGLVDAVQFRAVGDERTSPICRMYNKTIWGIDAPDIQRPPLHFRCRSRIVAYLGPMPDNPRDFTKATDGSEISPDTVAALNKDLKTFRSKYWAPPDLTPSQIPKPSTVAKYLHVTTPAQKQQLLNKFNKEMATRPDVVQEVKKWDDMVEQGTTSKTLNIIDGEYTPERLQIHDDIIDSFYKETTGDKKAVFFGGPSGSGKSGLLDYVGDQDNYVYINNDEIKKLLPEYNGFNSNFIHDEARDITEKLKSRTLDTRQNFIIDGTLRDSKKALKEFKATKELGYNVQHLSTNLPLENTMERALYRTIAEGAEGRYVPPGIIIKNTEKINRAQFDIINHADEGVILDTNVPFGAKQKILYQK